jgi:hypothetical protein
MMKKEKTGKGTRGKARVRVSQNGKVQVLFEGKEPITLQREDCPKSLKAGTFFVGLNGEADSMTSIGPWEGTLKAKFKNFAAKKDEMPSPRQVAAKPVNFEGKSFTVSEHLEFTPIFEITQDEFKGMTATGFFWYTFAEDEDGHVKMKGGGKQYDRTESFMDATGLSNLDLDFKENLLPMFQKRLLKEGREVMLNIKRGYIESLMEVPSYGEDDDAWDEDDEEEKVVAGEAPWDEDEAESQETDDDGFDD